MEASGIDPKALGVDPSALEGAATVYPLLGSTQAWTDARLREFGITNVRIVMAASSMEALKYMVAAGRGIGLFHRCCAEPDLRSGRIVALDVAGRGVRQPVFLAHAVRKRFAPAQARLLAFLKTGAALSRAIDDTIATEL